MSFFINLS